MFASAAHARSRFRLGAPQRLQDLQGQVGIGFLQRQRTDDGIGVSFQRIAPLLPVLGVAPSGFMRGNEPLTHLLEGHELGGLNRGSGLQLAAVLARVDPFGDQAAVVSVQLAGALEGNIFDRSNAAPLFLPGDRVTAWSKPSRLRCGLPDRARVRRGAFQGRVPWVFRNLPALPVAR